MQKLMVKVQDEARAVKQLMYGELPKLEKQLAETTGLFKGNERKALQEKIARVQQEIDLRMDRLPGILKEDVKTEEEHRRAPCGAYIETTGMPTFFLV